jgi:type IV pilus assembly protein PilV
MRRQLRSRGFTLIEVLVTLVILTFGLLGIAGLMAKGQRIAFEAYQRQQGVAFATDMAERIRGNRLLADVCPAGPACTSYTMGAPINTPVGDGQFYNDYRTGTIKDCATLVCTIQELALYDIALWDGLLNGYSEQQSATQTRVGGILNARGCIERIADTSGTCPVAPAPAWAVFTRTIRISVTWQGNDETVAPTAANSNCGANLYGTETRRRIITYDLTVSQPCL